MRIDQNNGVILAAIASLALSASAVPPNPAPAPSTGPDVVTSGVGSSSGSSPYGDSTSGGVTTNGTVGSIISYSVGTVSCNIGNATAIWVSSTNQHPLIGQHLYRYRVVNGAGQFDQIGISWLKHAWCAADSASCAQLTVPNGVQSSASGCTTLGLFATDTYGAGLNADQTDLGPRSEVNPWTGAYPYPYTIAWNQTGDAIFKRTQVLTADLIAGANYIMDVCYICTDEPVANRYNNYSYRTGTLSGTTISLNGSTETMRPAIVGWKEKLDNAVTLVNLDPSGTADGRIILGYKVTQTSPTNWHYEYCIFNMNNDAGVRSFALPVDASVPLSNVGFHDIFYHSGEPYSGTDWAFTNSAGTASWATQTFAQNANANALRWGTMYSFRFDAPNPPTNGTATLGMFKTGASVNAAVQVPSAPPPPAPGAFNLTAPAPGVTVGSLTPVLSWAASSNATAYTVKVATDAGLANVVSTGTGPGTSHVVFPALSYGGTYYWGVTAANGTGSTASSPASQSFLTPPPPCQGDVNADGHTNTSDLTILLGNFGSSVPPNTLGDLDANGTVNSADLTILLGGFGC